MKMGVVVETKVASYTGSVLSKKQSLRKIDEIPEQSLTKTVNVRTVQKIMEKLRRQRQEDDSH